MRALLLAIAIAVVVGPGTAGCGGAPTTGAQIDVAACAVDGIDDCALTFNGVPVTSDARFVVSVSNRGDETLEIDTTTLRDGDPAFAIALRPTAIAPGESANVVVTLRPPSLATFRTTLIIASNASNAPQVAVVLDATSIDAGVPDADFDLAGCAFGDVTLGDTATCEIGLRNVGVRDLIVDSVSFAACSNACPFRTSAAPITEFVLAPGTAASLPMLFAPPSAGAFEAEVSLFTNDPDEAEVVILLRGSGVAP
jgi:hypothetical protein